MKRLKIIGLVILLMIAAVLIVGRSINATYEKTLLEPTNNDILLLNHTNNTSDVFEIDKNRIIDKEASLKNPTEYFNNRAYQGAPPTIPHEVEGLNIGGKGCLKCHETGGYVDKFKANAPVVPHPELISCIQCHVPVNSKGTFKDSNWEKVSNINISNSSNQVLLTSPPVIPHEITKNDDCLSCHSGSGIKKIRVTHPERTNCKQCHVPKFIEPVKEEVFTRKPFINY